MQSLAWDAVEAKPAYGLDGDRHKGGVSLAQALAWNVGTWVTMPRERSKGLAPKAESTEAGPRDGSTPRSVEAW